MAVAAGSVADVGKGTTFIERLCSITTAVVRKMKHVKIKDDHVDCHGRGLGAFVQTRIATALCRQGPKVTDRVQGAWEALDNCMEAERQAPW